jgi:hypothetical protein
MRVNINRPHPLFIVICYLLFAYMDADAISKNHYPHMLNYIAILGYTNVINNNIHLPFYI